MILKIAVQTDQLDPDWRDPLLSIAKEVGLVPYIPVDANQYCFVIQLNQYILHNECKINVIGKNETHSIQETLDLPFSKKDAKYLFLKIKHLVQPDSAQVYFSNDDLLIDFSESVVWIQHEIKALTQTESKILNYLVFRPNQNIEKTQLLKKVLGSDVFVCDKTIDTHLNTIKKKVPQLAKNLQIKSEWVNYVANYGTHYGAVVQAPPKVQ